jgi:lipid-A-disaccharide synthase-like uncharacterized protein
MSLVGWAANLCNFGRFFVQWLASERSGKSVTPVVFWWISALGALLMTTYLVWYDQPVLVAGQLVNLAIYLRNLAMRRGQRRPLGPRLVVALFAGALLVLITAALAQLAGPDEVHPAWLAVAVVGQSIWSSRFLVQWWIAERSGDGRLTAAFWWVSLAGNGFLLAYALHLGSAVLIAGHLPGPVVQVRNLVLGSHARARKSGTVVDAP